MSDILRQAYTLNQTFAIDDLRHSDHKALVIAIQTRLCELGILDPEIGGNQMNTFGPISFADGRVGANTRNAIIAFQRYMQMQDQHGTMSPAFFRLLADSHPDTFFAMDLNPTPEDSPQTKFAKRILRYMQKKNQWIARPADAFNIVYVEGANVDGSPNPDAPNEWNDRRCVIRILPSGRPEMLVNDRATTEPGEKHTKNPMNPLGAARIAFGQFKAWSMGLHKDTQPAIVQVKPLPVHRDGNRNYLRDKNDAIDIGLFGINQHSTSAKFKSNSIGGHSAGCLVGHLYAYHLSFLETIKQDWRYLSNPNYVFISTVINANELAKLEPL